MPIDVLIWDDEIVRFPSQDVVLSLSALAMLVSMACSIHSHVNHAIHSLIHTSDRHQILHAAWMQYICSIYVPHGYRGSKITWLVFSIGWHSVRMWNSEDPVLNSDPNIMSFQVWCDTIILKTEHCLHVVQQFFVVRCHLNSPSDFDKGH